MSTQEFKVPGMPGSMEVNHFIYLRFLCGVRNPICEPACLQIFFDPQILTSRFAIVNLRREVTSKNSFVRHSARPTVRPLLCSPHICPLMSLVERPQLIVKFVLHIYNFFFSLHNSVRLFATIFIRPASDGLFFSFPKFILKNA